MLERAIVLPLKDGRVIEKAEICFLRIENLAETLRPIPEYRG